MDNTVDLKKKVSEGIYTIPWRIKNSNDNFSIVVEMTTEILSTVEIQINLL